LHRSPPVLRLSHDFVQLCKSNKNSQHITNDWKKIENLSIAELLRYRQQAFTTTPTALLQGGSEGRGGMGKEDKGIGRKGKGREARGRERRMGKGREGKDTEMLVTYAMFRQTVVK